MLKKNVFVLIIFMLVHVAASLSAQNLKLKNYCIYSDGEKNIFRKSFIFKKLDTCLIQKLNSKVLFSFADAGYPFCRIVNDSVIISNKNINIKSRLILGKKIQVGKILLVGKPKISQQYIENAIGISPGDIYCERKVLNINKNFSHCSFLVADKPAAVEFHPDDADIYIYLKNRRCNTASAIASVNYDDTNNRYYLSGNANLGLVNNFGKGDKFSLAWLGYGRESQQLDISASLPFCFGTRMSPELSAGLIKSDSLCLNTRLDPKVSFLASQSLSVAVLASFRQLVASDDGLGVESSKSQLYGAELVARNALGSASFSAMIGSRSLDSGRSPLAELSASLSQDINLSAWLVYEARGKAASLLSAQPADKHEGYKIGGYSSIRGFADNSIMCSRYLLLRNTLRFWAGDVFCLTAFYDAAAYRLDAPKETFCDTPQAFGLGFGIKIAQVNLDFSYAVPREFGRTKPLRDSQTHFSMILEF